MSWNYPNGFNANDALAYANLVQQAYFQYYIYAKVAPPFGYPPYDQIYQFPPGYTLLYEIHNPLETPPYYGFVAQNQSTGEIVFAIRGTEGYEEWLEDLLLANQTQAVYVVPKSYGEIHAGFGLIYQNFTYVQVNTQQQYTLEQVLSNMPKAVVTGHSLGGALATLLTLDIALNDSLQTVVTAAYTFASPMVGDPNFVNCFNAQVAPNGSYIQGNYRIANGWDEVPWMPPSVYYVEVFDTEADYAHVTGFCPIDGGLTTDAPTAHSLTSYVAGLNAILNPPQARVVSKPRGRHRRGTENP